MNPRRRHELTDEEWAQVAPHLPPPHPATGRPAQDHRTVLNGIVWIRRTGAPWCDLPDRDGHWQTVSSRVRRWRDAGLWDRNLVALPREAVFDDTRDGRLALIAGTNVRAHHQAAGAKKGASRPTSVGVAAAGGASFPS